MYTWSLEPGAIANELSKCFTKIRFHLLWLAVIKKKSTSAITQGEISRFDQLIQTDEAVKEGSGCFVLGIKI